MLVFTCDCKNDIKLHFRTPRDIARFELFDSDTGDSLGVSPDNLGSWDFKLAKGKWKDGGAFRLEVTTATLGGDGQPTDLKVDDSGAKDIDPDNQANQVRDADGWRLGLNSANAATPHLFDVQPKDVG